MARAGASRRQRGHTRRRGGSFQVLVYAGIDPLTGKDHYLTESTRDKAEARKILTRLLGAVD
ncbi:MAG TPA: site-specific integrase, partial [Pseudonocardia sp.]|nr:site-specific integrase [Pseudonocardia sp.]